MPTLDLIRISGSGALNTGPITADFIQFIGSGALSAQPSADFIKFIGSGPLRLVVDAFTDVGDTEPLTPLSFTAHVNGLTPNAYTWRVVSGPGTVLSTSGATVTFNTPPTLTGGIVTLGVIAHLGAQDSDERLVSISVLPATMQSRATDGTNIWAVGGLQRRQ